MGKMKTKVIGGVTEEVKSSADKYAEKKAKKAAMMKKEEVVNEVVSEEVKVEAQEEVKEEAVKTSPKQVADEKVRGKKYMEAKNKFSSSNVYKLEEAINLIKDIKFAKFDETFELHLTVKKQGLNVQVALPYSTGKQKRVEVATEKTLEDLKQGKINFDVLLATPEMMPKLAVFARVLGPKGLMPNPKNGTVIKSEKDAEKFKGNLVTLKTEREAPIVHTSFGKVSQKDEELVKNAEAILTAIGGSKTIVRAFMKSTMSPSVKVQV